MKSVSVTAFEALLVPHATVGTIGRATVESKPSVVSDAGVGVPNEEPAQKGVVIVVPVATAEFSHCHWPFDRAVAVVDGPAAVRMISTTAHHIVLVRETAGVIAVVVANSTPVALVHRKPNVYVGADDVSLNTPSS